MSIYNNDPNSADYCPDPNLIFAELGQSIQDRLCSDSKIQKDYTDAQISSVNTALSALQTSINNLSDQDTLTKINDLKALVETLDLDSDGSIVNDLLSIKTIAENAQTAANEAKATAQAAETKATQAQTDASTAVTTSQTALATAQSATAKALQNESNINDHETRITTLEGSAGSGSGLTIAQVEAMINTARCEQARQIAAGANAIAAKLLEACPVDPASSGTDGAPV